MKQSKEKKEVLDANLTWVKCDYCAADVPAKKGYPNMCICCLAKLGACCSDEKD